MICFYVDVVINSYNFGETPEQTQRALDMSIAIELNWPPVIKITQNLMD